MAVYQCPDCDLRFLSEAELNGHLRDEHPEFHVEPKSPEDAFLLENRRRRHRPTHRTR